MEDFIVTTHIDIVKRTDYRKIIRIGDYQSLGNSIIEYYKDPKKGKEDGWKGRKYFEKYLRDVLLQENILD